MLQPKEPSDVESAYCANEHSLKRFLRRFLHQREDIDDTLHEAFLRAYRAERDKRIAEPKAFLFKIARNLALNELAKFRNRRVEGMADFDAIPVTDGDNSPEQRAIIRQELGHAFDLINQLPPRVREVFLLRKLHGLSQKEIAERLGIAESTVEKHLAKGLVKMAALSGAGIGK